MPLSSPWRPWLLSPGAVPAQAPEQSPGRHRPSSRPWRYGPGSLPADRTKRRRNTTPSSPADPGRRLPPRLKLLNSRPGKSQSGGQGRAAEIPLGPQFFQSLCHCDHGIFLLVIRTYGVMIARTVLPFNCYPAGQIPADPSRDLHIFQIRVKIWKESGDPCRVIDTKEIPGRRKQHYAHS